MTATLEQLERAHSRMLGRVEAASIEYRRATDRYLRATGDDLRPAFKAQRAADRVVMRRLRAAPRLLDAMGGAR